MPTLGAKGWAMRLALLLLLTAALACSGNDSSDETAEEVHLDHPARAPGAAGPPAPTGDPTPAAQETTAPATAPNEEVPEAPTSPTERVEVPAADGTTAPLVPGQWVRYGLTWRDGSRSTMDYRVVGVSGDSTTLQIEDARRGHRKVFHMTVKFGDRRSPDSFEITALRVQDQGRTETIPDRMVQQYQPLLQHFLELMAVDWAGGEREDVEVPAGTFHGCTVKERDASYGGVTQHARILYHPGVPVTGMVRFAGQENNQTFELMGFGTNGPTQ